MLSTRKLVDINVTVVGMCLFSNLHCSNFSKLFIVNFPIVDKTNWVITYIELQLCLVCHQLGMTYFHKKKTNQKLFPTPKNVPLDYNHTKLHSYSYVFDHIPSIYATLNASHAS